jgi:hypothetical protein
MKDVKYCDNKTLSGFFSKREKSGFLKTLEMSPFRKSKFFQSEKEVRIVCRFKYGSSNLPDYLVLVNNQGQPLQRLKLESISTDSYQHKMALDIPIDLSIIKSITLGPNSALTVQDLRELLFIDDIDEGEIRIKESKGSYR